jgi:prepilin-type N-terminal cleavage/methylation domain-containing protein
MRHFDQKGFTLVEVVIAVALIGIILGLIASFSITTMGQSAVESSRASLQGESQIALDRAVNDIRLSAAADENNRWNDANKAGGGYTWESNASTLVLATAVVDSGNNIIFADPAKYISEKNNIIYFVSGNKLYKRTLASTVANNAAKTTCPANAASASCPPDRELLQNVSAFTVKYFNGDNQEVTPADARAIELNIKTSTRKFSQNITSDYTTRAVFRND